MKAWRQTPAEAPDGCTNAGAQAIHVEFKGAYCSPRIVIELRLRGFPASKERVERLMRENGIKAKHKRRFKVTTDSKHDLLSAPNLLNRNFAPDAPNRVRTSDITYLWTDEGWLYMAIVLDLFNREVVGWSLKPRMTADIVTNALRHSVVSQQTHSRADTPLGSRQPIRQPCISRQAEGIRHGLLDKSPQRYLDDWLKTQQQEKLVT